jgi:hypothetical protein
MVKSAIVCLALGVVPFVWADNQVLENCLEEHDYSRENFNSYDFNKAAACFSAHLVEIQKQIDAELKDFMKHNPRYGAPGQSLNRCFGEPREQAFESIEVDHSEYGYNIRARYKEKMPQPCYENAPWDNRSENI